MHRLFCPYMLALLLPVCHAWAADSSVTLPWPEFEGLYKERIEARLKPEKEPEPVPIVAFRNAVYQFQVDEHGAQGVVHIDGELLRGREHTLALFAHDVVVTRIQKQQGARVLVGPQGYQLYIEHAASFSLVLSVSLAITNEGGYKHIRFAVPRAVKNALRLELPEGLQLVDDGRLRGTSGRYFFSPAETLELRLVDDLVQHQRPDLYVDSFTRLILQGGRLQATTYFVPTRPIRSQLRVTLGAGVTPLGSSLEQNWLSSNDAGETIIDFPGVWHRPFSIRYDVSAVEQQIKFVLPAIAGNKGYEGAFLVEPVAGARVRAESDDLQNSLPRERLSADLARFAGVDNNYQNSNSTLMLEIDRLQTVKDPRPVLDAVYFYVSFTDNGSALSIMHFELPQQAEPAVSLEAVPGSEIWSAHVNGRTVDLYLHEDRWIIPLQKDTKNNVRVAFLRRGQKLGLDGRLAMDLPATGLFARRINVAVGLSERIDLIAMDGDLEPANPKRWPEFKEFTGKPYYFTRPYYRGQPISAAIYYKEPVQHKQEKQL